MTAPIARWLRAALASAALVAAVTAVIALLEPGVPALGLGVLYLLAVVPIALMCGSAVAAVVSVASMAAFDYFFLPPRYNFDPGTSQQWEVLVAFLVSSLVAGQLAARSQREARRSARIADAQAALRRVATLVAHESPPAQVFAAVAEELKRLFDARATTIGRLEPDGTMTIVAAGGTATDELPVGRRVQLESDMTLARVVRTGQAARVDDYSHAPELVGGIALRAGVRCSVAVPVMVHGSLWGSIGAGSERGPFPRDAEQRMAQFTDLVATAIANTEARGEVERLADEQAALRRVATLVAEGVQPAEIFSVVTREVARLFVDVEPSVVPSIIRFDPGPEFVLVGAAEPMYALPIGSRWGLKELYVSTRVLRTGRSARVDESDLAAVGGPDAVLLRRQAFLYQVGSPIVVEGRVWGAMTMNSTEALPPDTGERLESFTELVGTAIANAESREALGRLANEQATLRRVATLVAEGASPAAVFDAVAGEMQALLDSDQVALNRFELGNEIVVLAHRGLDTAQTPVGSRVSTEGQSVTAMVRRTGRPARMENYERARGALAELARATGLRSSVSAPIVVEGRLWGVITASWKREQSPPADTEERMVKFAGLLGTAIANADSRDQLNASRARLLSTGDEARRRLVRDLHDGAQQRLVHTVVTLQLAQQAMRENSSEAETLVAEALQQAEHGNTELRELAHGILPSVLTRGGLRAGVDSLVARLDLSVDVQLPDDRYPADIEASAYFIVAEALTNVVKHSRAVHAEVTASAEDELLHVEIRDDGTGGADPNGHGLVGMDDRVTALGGRLRIESPAGRGTLVAATLPLSGGASASAS
jgi:signal transduction histidine kinase